uniref:U11-Eretoxin-Ek1k_1 n=1 Tax=Eresus cinnaberinus TaxID=175337 RepID=A0A2D0PCA9_ERECI
MVSHMTSIVLLFALFLGLAECAKCPYAKFTPQHSFLQRSKYLNVTNFGTKELQTSSQTTPCRLTLT